MVIIGLWIALAASVRGQDAVTDVKVVLSVNPFELQVGWLDSNPTGFVAHQLRTPDPDRPAGDAPSVRARHDISLAHATTYHSSGGPFSAMSTPILAIKYVQIVVGKRWQSLGDSLRNTILQIDERIG